MKILFIYAFGDSNYEDNLLGSFLSVFENNPNFEYKYIAIGNSPNQINNSKSLNESLIKEEFDLAFVCEDEDVHIDLATAELLGKKLFICNWDVLSHPYKNDITKGFVNYISDVNKIRYKNSKYSLLNLSRFCNILSFDFGFGQIFENIYGVVCPHDTRFFYPDTDKKTPIDVLFNGNTHMDERVLYINEIYNNKIDIKVTGGFLKKDMNLSRELYAEQFRKSKICLSFSQSMFCYTQRKSRVTEILASGSLCMMTHPETLIYNNQAILIENEHFVSMNFSDCVDKINFYLSNEKERLRIARNGYEYYINNLSPKPFWEYIFKISGIQL